MEAAQFDRRPVWVAFSSQHQRGGLRVAPFGAQWFDHRRQHQAFDVGARRVVRAEFVAVFSAERALQQGAEDRGFDVVPLRFGGLDQ